jgi:hypothetical protein
MKTRSVFSTTLLLLFALGISACSQAKARPTSTPRPTLAATSTLAPSATAPTPTLPQMEGSFGGGQGGGTPAPIPSLAITPLTLEDLPEELKSLRIAYIFDQKLWFWDKGISNSLVEVGVDYYAVDLSSDGELLAYKKAGGLWAIHSDGTNEGLLVGEDYFKPETPGPTTTRVNSFAWVKGTHQLLFNTAESEFESEGNFPPMGNDDLYIVEADRPEIKIVVPPGQGGSFFVSPDGKKIAVSTPTSISVMDFDGGHWTTLLTFPVVYTYSEVWYYPDLFWSPDSHALAVSIPAHDPMTEQNPLLTIWYLPVNGEPARQITQIPDSMRSATRASVGFSPDLAYLVYTLEACQDPEAAYEVHFFKMDGSADQIYGCVSLPRISWAPDGRHFFFRKDVVHLGELGGKAVSLPGQGSFGTWIDANYFFAYVYGFVYIQSVQGNRILINIPDLQYASFTK